MKADPKAEAAAAPKSSPKKRILIIIMAVLTLATGGAATWYFTRSADAGAIAHKKEKAKPGEPPVYVPIEKFVVNLQPEEGEQYLQIQFTLQVPALEQVEILKANMPKIQSRVLLLLSAKKASELSTPAGKQQLSSELIASINEPFVDKGAPQEVTDVLYTSFIIQ